MKIKKLAILSFSVLFVSVIALKIVCAAEFIRTDKTLEYNNAVILTHTVDTNYFVSLTPYTISDSGGIYVSNSTSYKSTSTGLYMKHKSWNILANETYHRYFNDQTLPSGYASASIKSVSTNKTSDSSIFAKFGINDPWNA